MADRTCLPERVDNYGERFEDANAHGQFLQALEESHNQGVIHDCLEKGNGLPLGSVMFWKAMEYLPFRRMDLHEGSWRVIRW